MRKKLFLIAALCVASILAGCNGAALSGKEPTATTAPTGTNTPTLEPTATATPEPTATLEPTTTPEPTLDPYDPANYRREGDAYLDLGDGTVLSLSLIEETNTYAVALYKATSAETIVIPEEYEGKKITVIDSLFAYNYGWQCEGFEGEDSEALLAKNLKKIVLPETITSISESAFVGCISLTDINLPKKIKSIPTNAFGGCGFTKLEIPSNIEMISDYAFAWCKKLEEVTFAEGLSSIYNGAFESCINLSKVTLPSTLKYIGGYNGLYGDLDTGAFYYCMKLTDIVLPDGLMAIGPHAFDKTGITSVNIPDSVISIGYHSFGENTKISGGKNCLYSDGKTTFALDGVKVGNGDNTFEVKDTWRIGYFSGASDNIVVPDSVYGKKVTAIANRAFSNATVTLPDEITDLGGEAFGNCTVIIKKGSLTDTAFSKNNSTSEKEIIYK